MNSLLKKLLVVALATPAIAFAQVNLDKVVATVAGEPVTAQEVQERINTNLAILKKQAKKPVKLTAEQQKNIAQGSLQEVLEDRVMLNQARKAGINITDADVSAALGNIAQGQGLTVDAFKERVTKAGGEKAWATLNRDLKNDMTIDALKNQEVIKKVKATPEEIEAFLAERKLGAKNPIPKTDGLDALHIYVNKNNAASLKKIQLAKTRIDKGEPFETVGAAVSDRQGSASELIFIDLKDEKIDANVRTTLTKLADGSVSDVVKTKNGLYLFKAVTHKTVEFTLEQQKEEAAKVVAAKKADSELQTWYSNLMENAKKNLIEIK